MADPSDWTSDAGAYGGALLLDNLNWTQDDAFNNIENTNFRYTANNIIGTTSFCEYLGEFSFEFDYEYLSSIGWPNNTADHPVYEETELLDVPACGDIVQDGVAQHKWWDNYFVDNPALWIQV